ncbi:MAG TPA: hypothetical protein VGQ11_09535 [Candidatus Acidoferrales bacterium]|jgi:hypothetical protein|nr:hypothetical protein [Candidatus Acidoferrales bacterium]
MADTVADVLVRLGVDTSALRAGYRDVRNETSRLALDLVNVFTGRGGGRGLLGNIVNFITGLFTRGAKNAAKNIARDFQEIIAAFNAGSTKLGETIRRLESERASAIQRLSGKKGGRKELDKLLPQFDEALASLRSQQQAVFEQFDEQLDLLRTGEAFREVAAEVREAVREFRNYVDAGGDLAKANEFLSLTLEQLRARSAEELAGGEEQAIEDALRLNNLLREREELLASSAEEERSILSRGVLERQRTIAQDKSVELEALRRRRDERLADLDQSIRVQQLKVDAESRVFTLTRDRVALEMRLLDLKALEFDREAAKLAALKDIVAGVVPGAGGLFSLTPALRQVLNLGGVQIFVGENATPDQARTAGEQVIEGMLRGLLRERARFGMAS